MKRFILFLFFFFLFSVPAASAHPGHTDSNGGHTDRSTGEYHYHHGYEEHQHYDMNGDGINDCPYDFKDKTGSSSVPSSRSTDVSNPTTPPKSRKISFWNSPVNGLYVVLFLIIFLISIPIIGYVLSKILYFLLIFFEKLFH